MSGAYRMVNERGEVFEVEIPAFSLGFAVLASLCQLTDWRRGSLANARFVKWGAVF